MKNIIEATPLTPTIGVEVHELNVNQMNAATFAELRALWLDHRVVFIRDQTMDVDALCALGRRFGSLMRLPYIEPVDGYPDVIRVLKQATDVGVGVFGGEWHTDFSFLEAPPMASLLYAVELPPSGGDTLWADMVSAWQHLPARDQQLLEGRHAIHVGAPYGTQHAPEESTRAGQSIRIERDNPEADQEMAHPAVVTHPQTGERMLNVNPTYTTRIDGLEPDVSDALLARVYAHAIRPEFTCRFRWSPGTLAIWDNRSTMHYAVNDYDGSRRELLRVTVKGERPVV